MDSRFYEEAQRLQLYRQGLLEQGSQTSALGSSVKIGSGSSGESSSPDELNTQQAAKETGPFIEPLHDPLMYPGLYSPSGFDMMGILVRVRTRPNPVIDIGNIDSSVALVLCDTTLPDMPIVYCSETFESLTEYPTSEILGRNCRFLQRPYQPGNVEPMVQELNAEARSELKYRFSMGEEARVRLVNYKRSGTKFVNLLTTIPITWDEGEPNAGPGKRYIVGFQADSQTPFRSR